MSCFCNAGTPRQRRMRWGCVLLRTSLASDLWRWKGSVLPKLPRWLWAGCMQALGWWIGMTGSYCAIWFFWVIWSIEVISWCHLILWVIWLNPKSLCPLWPRAGDSRRRRERWKAWSKAREKGRAHARGETTIFQERTWAVSPNSDATAPWSRQQGLIQHTEINLPT